MESNVVSISGQPAQKFGKFSEERVEALKKEHQVSRLVYLTNPETGHEVLCKPVTQAEWNRFQSWLDDPSSRTQCSEKLFRLVCVAYDPGHPSLDDMLYNFPALADTFVDSLLKMAGLNRRSEKRLV